MSASLKSWLEIPLRLRDILENQEKIMAQNDRVLVAADALRRQNEALAALAAADAQADANLQKAVDDLRGQLADANVSEDALAALEAAVKDNGSVVEAFRKAVDPQQETPAPGDVTVDPAPGVDPVDETPVDSGTPGVPVPGGEGSPEGDGQVPGNADSPDTDDSAAEPAPPVPTDSEGNDRTDVEGIPDGTVDNSDGFLSDANNADQAEPTGDNDRI